MKKPFYVTTPIYYASGDLHIGHAYTTVLADILARYKSMCGHDVFMLTGSDEHGQKIEEAAKEANMNPKEFVDKVVNEGFKPLFKKLQINESIFMRTSNDFHKETIQKIFSKMQEKELVYKGKYKGLYCVKCEAFYTESQLEDGMCPDHQIKCEELEQESYMFKMSEFQEWITDLMKSKGDALASKGVQKELLNNFIEPGLTDLSLTRTNFKWGVPVKGDEEHVVYVWLDALFNYVTALGYRVDSNEDDFDKYWGKESEIVHIVGQDITRFHCIYWPIFLKTMDLRLPTKIITHGLIRDKDGKKMSKSLGNGIEPNELINTFGVDAVRFFLAKEIRTGDNGNMDIAKVPEKFNAFLANMYGNLVSRTIGMIGKYFNGTNPSYNGQVTEHCKDLEDSMKQKLEKYHEQMNKYEISSAIETTIELLNDSNKYIDLTAPWVLAKDDSKKDVLASVMNHLVKAIEITSLMLDPVVVTTTDLLLEQIPFKARSFDTCLDMKSNDGIKLEKKGNLYSRLD